MDELRGRPVEKATANETFRARSLSDPKGVIEEELGLAVPASLSIEVHKESAVTTHPILPPHSKLSESGLQAVAGGRQSKLFGQNVDTAISDRQSRRATQIGVEIRSTVCYVVHRRQGRLSPEARRHDMGDVITRGGAKQWKHRMKCGRRSWTRRPGTRSSAPS